VVLVVLLRLLVVLLRLLVVAAGVGSGGGKQINRAATQTYEKWSNVIPKSAPKWKATSDAIDAILAHRKFDGAQRRIADGTLSMIRVDHVSNASTIGERFRSIHCPEKEENSQHVSTSSTAVPAVSQGFQSRSKVAVVSLSATDCK
jgi:hypothetical protein|tara:strand:+ start:234 stop:671 length:438 start_codon:yes stop_codon:yes gene_type:complete